MEVPSFSSGGPDLITFDLLPAGLEAAFGRPEVVFTVRELLAVDDGSVVLAAVKRQELGLLNEVRPVVQQRALKMLFMPLESQGGIAAARNEAPDFVDWASYVVEADLDLAEVVRVGLESARGVAPAVVWRGPPIGPVLDASGVKFEVLSARDRHSALHAALRDKEPEAVVWTDVVSQQEQRRVEWVLALTRWRPSLSLVQATDADLGWAVADVRTVEPWDSVGLGTSRWDIALTGCAMVGSLSPSRVLSRVVGAAVDLPETKGRDAAWQAMAEGQFDTAEFALSTSRDDDPVLHARVLLEQGDLAAAETLLESAVEREGASYGRAVKLQGLGNIYARQRRYEAAEEAYREAVSINETLFGRSDPRSASALHGLGFVFEARKQYAEAEGAYRRSLEMFERSPATVQNAVAPLQGLGNVYEKQGRLAEAESAYQRAMVQIQRSYGPENPKAAAPLHGLGNVYAAQGRLEDAEKAFSSAVRIGDGPPNSESALTFRRLGDVYAQQGKYVESEGAYREALRTLDSLDGSSPHPVRVDTLLGLANVYRRQGRYSESNRLLSEATQASRDNPG